MLLPHQVLQAAALLVTVVVSDCLPKDYAAKPGVRDLPTSQATHEAWHKTPLTFGRPIQTLNRYL
jgi:hypothetical protein